MVFHNISQADVLAMVDHLLKHFLHPISDNRNHICGLHIGKT